MKTFGNWTFIKDLGSENLGYVVGCVDVAVDNIVSCCNTCNYMKKSMSYSEFVSHIEKLAKNLIFPNLSQGDKK